MRERSDRVDFLERYAVYQSEIFAVGENPRPGQGRRPCVNKTINSTLTGPSIPPHPILWRTPGGWVQGGALPSLDTVTNPTQRKLYVAGVTSKQRKAVKQNRRRRFFPRPVVELDPALTKQSTARRRGAHTSHLIYHIATENQHEGAKRPCWFSGALWTQKSNKICEANFPAPAAELDPALTKQSTALRRTRYNTDAKPNHSDRKSTWGSEATVLIFWSAM